MNERNIFFRKKRLEIKRLKQEVIWLFRNIFFTTLPLVFRFSEFPEFLTSYVLFMIVDVSITS